MFEIATRIAIFIASLSGLIGLLSFYVPTLPPEVVTAIAFFIDAVNDWGFVLPLASISSILASAITFYTLLALWDIGSWLLTKFTR